MILGPVDTPSGRVDKVERLVSSTLGRYGTGGYSWPSISPAVTKSKESKRNLMELIALGSSVFLMNPNPSSVLYF